MNSGKIIITKANGKSEEFNPLKLENSLILAGSDQDTAQDIVEQITAGLTAGMSTSHIYKHAFSLLHNKQKIVATRYSLRRAIAELGPSGFPFEKFIAELLREQGYETLTDQMVLGECVPHEVDVIAWNDDKLIMAEAKFHNEFGLKSDVKVALYIKARMDDLKDNKFFYGKERNLDEGWLVTNTKFTETAIHYGECKGLTMIGWNYPKKGNLQDMIIANNLHPITTLSSLSGSQKNMLIARGIILCKTLKLDSGILHSLGFNEVAAREVLEEIEAL